MEILAIPELDIRFYNNNKSNKMIKLELTTNDGNYLAGMIKSEMAAKSLVNANKKAHNTMREQAMSEYIRLGSILTELEYQLKTSHHERK